MQKIKMVQIDDYVVKMQIVINKICSGIRQGRIGLKILPAAILGEQMGSSWFLISPIGHHLKEYKIGSMKLISMLHRILKFCWWEIKLI